MNRDQLKGKWKQFTGEAKRKWGELTDDEIDQAEGDTEKLAGIVQERYGIAREEAKEQVDSWVDSLEE